MAIEIINDVDNVDGDDVEEDDGDDIMLVSWKPMMIMLM
jgi:hypothetical protein